MFIRPLVDFKALVYAAVRLNLLQHLLSLERRFVRRFNDLEWRHPSADVYNHTSIKLLDERLRYLQKRFINRCLQGTSASAQLMSEYEPPCQRRKPKYKYLDPVIALLSQGERDEMDDRFLDEIDNASFGLRH